MRKLKLVAVAALGVAVLAVGSAVAGGDHGNGALGARLDGFQEVVGPGSISTVADGRFQARVDVDGRKIEYTLSYSRLETSAIQAHIHFAQRHVGGGVIAFLCGGGGKPACPATSGTVTGVISASDIIGPGAQGIEPGSFDEVVRALRAGAVYANVHSTRFPAGEIRGQVGHGHGEGSKHDD